MQETSDHMAEPATATVRKAFVISLCQADSNYSQHGGGVIHHIDTLHHLKRFRNSANANGHIQPVYAQTFLQSNPAMDACLSRTHPFMVLAVRIRSGSVESCAEIAP